MAQVIIVVCDVQMCWMDKMNFSEKQWGLDYPRQRVLATSEVSDG